MDSKILANHDDTRYVDLLEPQDSRKGGAMTHPLLLEGSRRCYRLDNGQQKPSSPPEKLPTRAKQILRCIARKGCNVTRAMPQNKERILDHLSSVAGLILHYENEHVASLGRMPLVLLHASRW
jgi:hypothetical protein